MLRRMYVLIAIGIALAPASMVPGKLADNDAVIFCGAPGCKVKAKLEGGGARTLAAGTRVRFVEDDAMAGGDGADALATIEVDGKSATVPNVNVLLEERLIRSPSGKAAVFTAISGCGDFCHSDVWVITAGKAAKLADADPGPERPLVAWSPDEARVAVGTWVLHVVELGAMAVRQDDDTVSPAFAPDGKLYARDKRTHALVAVAADGTRKMLGKVPRGKKPQVEEGDIEPYPAPPEFEQGGNVVVVRFERVKGEVAIKTTVGAAAPAPAAQ